MKKFERGTSPGRHPWFDDGLSPTLQSLKQRYGTDLASHTSSRKNYGILGGWLICEFWTVEGEPTGITRSLCVPDLPVS